MGNLINFSIFSDCQKEDDMNSSISGNLIKQIFIINNKGLGFFYKIPVQKDKFMVLLITNSQILNKKNFEPNANKQIKFILYNGTEINFEINLDESRNIYINEEFKVAIIEIKENEIKKINDKINISNSEIYDENKKYEEKINYIVYYDSEIGKIDNKKIQLKEINKDIIEYKGDEDIKFYLGSILVNDNGNIIGFHIKKKEDINIGILFRNIIDEYRFSIYNNEMTIKYKINEEKEITIFGNEFVNNNNKICKIIINGKEEELCSNFNTENIILNDDNILEITLVGLKNITNMSSMFSYCDTLISISDISKLNTSKVIQMNNLFCNCESLLSLPDISKWDISNITDISGLFSGCSLLESLPDISKWNTSNVKDINFIFSGCSSLKSLPDISKWNISKVTNMKSAFSGCSSLISLPNISEWDISNVSNMSKIFSECNSLQSFPDISKWKMDDVTNISHMFCKCSSLKSLPDISKWNISNVKYMNSIFEDCQSLESLPDISKWNTENITGLFSIFLGCSSLKSLPDISKWKTNRVTDMSSLFSGCSSLLSLPDISKWNTNNVNDMSNMFEGCASLESIPDILQWNISHVNFKNDMFKDCNPSLNIPKQFLD